MRKSLVLALAFLVGVAVSGRNANAQSAAPPVEVGVDASTTPGPDRPALHWGPRVVVNFDGHNAMQFTASLQNLSPQSQFSQIETDLYLAACKRLVHAAGPIRVSANLGGGFERTVIVTPAITFGNPAITFPSTRGAQVRPAFTTGAVFDFRLGRRAAIVLESSLVLTDRLDARFSGGLVVPLGPYPSETGRLASSVPWAQLDPGERAWVTTGDGREVDGEVVGRSDARLTLRTRTGTAAFTISDVRAIDTTDPIRNGTLIGMTVGAAGMVVPSVLATLIVCSEETCSPADVLEINGLLLGLGAGVGAATGALVDSLRVRRVPLYRRGDSASVAFAPIVGRHRLGGGAVIRW